MMDAETQMINYSPGPSHSAESSDSEESSGLDIPSNEPTQLLDTTQLLDSYDRYGEEMYDASRTQQLDNMDMDTQLMEDDGSYDFGDRKGVGDDCTMIIPSEDEGSKDTQLITADDEGDSGTSSWKDDEVDSGSSPFRKAFTEMADNTRGEGSAGDSGGGNESHQDIHKSGNSGALAGSRGRNRNSRSTEEERYLEPSVVVLLPIDPDVTENEDPRRGFNSGSTYPGEANSSQNINSGRLSAYSSGNFCQQDLNQLPEPETQLMDDDWGGVNGEDLGIIGRIDDGGSNLGILDRHEAPSPPKSSPLVNRTGESVPTAENRSLPKSKLRTPGSIRTASLRASAIRASSCSTSSRHRFTPGESQNESVSKVERDGNITPTCAAARSAGFVTPASRLSSHKGIPSSAASVASVRSNSQDAGEFSESREMGILSENVKERTAGESNADNQERPKTSPSGSQSSKSADQRSSKARRLFSGNEVGREDVVTPGKHEGMQTPLSNASEDGKERGKRESTPPSINDSQPEKRMERRSSFGSGLFSQNSELSYLNFQSPGEDSQARALNMVDKLVWLNANDLSQEPLLEEENARSRLPSNAKNALQSRVQVADAKAGKSDPFDVFDWVDSQHDEAGIFFGIKGANALKAPSKSAGAAIGHPKQNGIGMMRRPGVLDASGLRTKPIEKIPEIPSKPAAKSVIPKGPLPKSAASSKENRNDQQIRLGKISSTGPPAQNSGEAECAQTASNLDASGWRVANKAFRDSEVPNNLETVMPKLAAPNSLPEVASKTALQKSDGLDALPGNTGVQNDQHLSRVSEQLLKTNISEKETENKVEETKSLAHAEHGDPRNQQLDGTSTAFTDMPRLNLSKVFSPLQNDGSGRGMASAVLPGLMDSRDDQARVSKTVREQGNPESTFQEDGSLKSRVEHHEAAESGDEEQEEEDNGIHCEVGGIKDAPRSISSPGKEAEDVTQAPSVREINMGPDTLGAVEAIGMMSTDFPAPNAGEPDDAPEDNQASDDDENDDDKAAGSASETDDGIQGRRTVTRRSRTQGRRNAGVENNGPQKENEHPKSRTRRVTWAGPLEQPQSTTGIRRGRSAKHQQNPNAELDPHTSRPSSDREDEEANDGSVNGDRIRNSKSAESKDAKDIDLDKIKKKFNMSDSAVARLLGTDEDDDDDGIKRSHNSPGVKTRSLSHIQPQVEEDEAAGATKGKVGKGLRSNGNRRRACTTPNGKEDEEDSEEERTGSPCDTDAGETSGERTPCVELNPSDNEAAPGRRRMRSIADVSSLSTSRASSGRPPQSTGSRRGGRGRRPTRSPAEHGVTHSEAEHLPPVPPTSASAPGRPRGGRGGPRSARKRKEPEPLKGVNITSPSSSREASTTSSRESPKKTRGENVRVLFSHGLPEDVGKKQRKIVAKLKGTATSSAFECTHFVADKFVRTGNMLEAMAAGKPVVTPAWLESCDQAKCFVDEHPYILRDRKKESEMGFSMESTLMEAQQRPLLEGIRVYITPGTTPGPDALAKIVKAAGGQVVSKYDGPAPDGDRKSDFCLVLSSEEELALCTPLLEQGAKVFTSELLLSGVMCHNLDFSNDQLFQNFSNKRRRASLSRRIF